MSTKRKTRLAGLAFGGLTLGFLYVEWLKGGDARPRN